VVLIGKWFSFSVKKILPEIREGMAHSVDLASGGGTRLPVSRAV